MKKLILLAIRAYPKAWRDRYEGELEALIEDSKTAGARELFDVMRGGVGMRMKHLNGWQLAATFGAAGMVLMAAAAFALPDEYASAGTFGIPVSKEEAAKAVNQAVYDTVAPDGDLRRILDRNGLKSLNLEDAKKRLIIRPVENQGDETAVKVEFDSHDAPAAKAVAQQYMSQLMTRLSALGVAAKAIDEPLLPSGPFWPNRRFMILLGLAAGSILGGIAALVKRRMRPAQSL